MRYFTDPDAWTGGHYELAIELRDRSDYNLRATTQALWSSPDLSGPYRHDDREHHLQTVVGLDTRPVDWKLFGLATIPGTGATPCLTVPLRFDEGVHSLQLCVPLGGLSRILPVGGFPFEETPPGPWVTTLEDWLASVGRHVFLRAKFSLAVIGFETDDWKVDQVWTRPRSESFLVARGEELEFLRRDV